MLKRFAPVLAISMISTLGYAATAIQNNTNFLNQQLDHMVNATGVTPLANWFQHIQVSALLNLDVFAQNNANYLNSAAENVEEGSESGFNVSTLALNLDAQVNSWVSGHVSLFYATPTQPTSVSSTDDGTKAIPTRYYPAAENGSTNSNINGIDLDDAYVDIMNFNKAPIDVRIGRQYFGFGSYDRYAMMPTLTQQLTEVRNTGAQLNWISRSGIYGDAFAFRGIPRFKSDTDLTPFDVHLLRNFGGTLGFHHKLSMLDVNLSAGYIYQSADIGAQAQSSTAALGRSGEWDANGSVAVGPAMFGIQYAKTISPVIGEGWDETQNSNPPKYAKPEAGNIYMNYHFKTMGYNSKLNVSYQWSKEANTFNGIPGLVDRTTTLLVLPESRVAGEYDVNVLKNTMLGFEVNYDSAYSKEHNGSGDNSITGIARLSVLL